ncbi:MAG: hypothetical protein Q4A01_03705 [Coriobacteriales bacterium]|nr:hypothetical protein [Coriobacteriales bacterium]
MVVEELARRFPQLCVRPAQDAEEAYVRAVTKGIVPDPCDLSHFGGSDADWLRTEHTPAGEVEVLFLARREDFETFLRCTTRRCRPEAIPTTIGAMTLDGLVDWECVRAYRALCALRWDEGGKEEFAAFVADRSQYRVTLVLLSEGPYSALGAEHTPYDEQTWLRVSREIRLYHELAHVTCRRLMPNDKPPVWDELTADAHGLLRATGAYDLSLALRFLGIQDGRYAGGRLQEYLCEEQREHMDAIVAQVLDACAHIDRFLAGARQEDSYDLLLALKRDSALTY